MSSKLNSAWHRTHRMPKGATLDQRMKWHAAHAKACGCRQMPASIAAELRRWRQAEGRRRKNRSAGLTAGYRF